MNQIHFGIPTLIELKSIEDYAALCKEFDFQFVEFNMNLPEYQADTIDTDAFAQIAVRYGIYYTIHLDENLNPCDFNEKVANAYTETVLQTIELAKRLHIPVLNMHMPNGVYFTLPGKKVYLFDKYRDLYLERLTAFRDRCTALIKDAGIKICIENGGGDFEIPFVQNGLHLLLQSQAFSLTFDIGHNATHEYADEHFILRHADRLCHMHIHDAISDTRQSKKNHLPLGTGELDLPKYFCLANKHNCRAVLEIKTVTGLKESVKWIKINVDKL